MTLAMPGLLSLLLLVPALAAVAGLAGWRHRRRLASVFSGDLLERVLPRSVRVRRLVRDTLASAGVALAVVALAEPRFDQQLRTVKARGTDIVVLLDLSRSMDARDVDPSRLQRARRELEDLGRLLEGDRIGLVEFAGGAFPRLPLTNDFKAVTLVVSEADTDTFDTQGSNLGAAIDVGLELLGRSEGEAGRALLVLSDGETHDAERAMASARKAAEAGVAVYAMGIGVEQAPIPMRDGRFLEYQGEVATTTPDFEILQQVARETGGAFVTSNASSRDMEGLYRALRDTVRAVERDAVQRETWQSAYQVPLAFGAFAWLAAAWLGDGRRRFGAAAGLLLAVAVAAPSPALAADALMDADVLYREGKYDQAAQKLVELSLEQPDDPQVLNRLGAARYKSGDFEGAARAFDQAARLGDDDALFNAGNALYQAGHLSEAVERYDRLVAEHPDHEAAATNSGIVTREIEARRAQKPPPPPQPKEGPRQDGQSGEDQQPQGSPDQQPQDGGESSDGQEGEGEQPPQDGQPQPGGEPGEPGEEPPPSDGGADGQQEPGSEPVDPSQATPDGQADPSDGEPTDPGATGQPGDEGQGPITAAQADRLLESVEEGSPRTVVQGRGEGKPW